HLRISSTELVRREQHAHRSQLRGHRRQRHLAATQWLERAVVVKYGPHELAVYLEGVGLGGVDDVARLHTELVEQELAVLNHDRVSLAGVLRWRGEQRTDLVWHDELVDPLQLCRLAFPQDGDPDLRLAARRLTLQGSRRKPEEVARTLLEPLLDDGTVDRGRVRDDDVQIALLAVLGFAVEQREELRQQRHVEAPRQRADVHDNIGIGAELGRRSKLLGDATSADSAVVIGEHLDVPVPDFAASLNQLLESLAIRLSLRQVGLRRRLRALIERNQGYVARALSIEAEHPFDAVAHARIESVSEHEEQVPLPLAQERLPELVEPLAIAKEVISPA